MEVVLCRRLIAGFTLAVLVMGLLAFLSRRIAKQAADNADWVVHTQAVLTTIEAAQRHLVDVETGSRGYSLTGHKPFLEPYKAGELAGVEELDALRRLTADNSDQRR